MKKELMEVQRQEQLAESIFRLELSGTLVRQMQKPGQFVHVKTGGAYAPLLRRPISIAEIDNEKDTFTMIYRAEGEGTLQLSGLRKGDQVDVLGPLGNGFDPDAEIPGTTALLAGGGIGVPPLYELSKRLKNHGVNVIHVLGFQNERNVFYHNEFAALGETYVATVDGSYGEKGFVTDVIKNNNLVFNSVFAVGPNVMLKAMENSFPDNRMFLSLEERMGCGIGACFACVCKTAEGSYKKICVDGPVFQAGEVLIPC
ncbi:dihydroorotate dehydrogenase electron transfer subunit [Bacillus lacus]|uniref:Dihydroorotate dehydrogenase B (NAD(+)), electron transfer subunit n=1 Tax=Metabacillus lacus TaxID=1983721 RepID=A0A7X2J0S6_9BACI|nr:dihydroorotate dehydrogenase electron transfer subunit [Metabacillus lacus]MRX73335.1 dihydroorotate dehydrogenase electron transfer subunit [Metabacillus lacus]